MHELKNSIPTLLISSVYSGIVIYFSTQGYTKVYLDYQTHHPFWAFAGFFIILLIDDAWFYWLHRLLHHPKLYKYVHQVHHESIDVNPFTSLSFHWVEAALLTLWIIPVSFILPIYAPILGLVQVWGLFDNLKGHLGYEFFPANFNKSPLQFMTTSTHHSMHHSKFNGNYGVHFRFWDKLFGTEFNDYEHTFEQIQQRKKGLTIITNQEEIGAIKAQAIVHFKGKHAINVYENETLLDAIIWADLAVPYACREGKCGTCKCQLVEGKVSMKAHEALEQQEVNRRFILACQSIPATEGLTIEY